MKRFVHPLNYVHRVRTALPTFWVIVWSWNIFPVYAVTESVTGTLRPILAQTR